MTIFASADGVNDLYLTEK